MKNIQEQKLKFRKKQLILKQRNKMTAKIKPNLYNLEIIFTMPQFSKTLLRKYENHVIQERQCFFKWRSLKNFLNYKVTYFWNYQNHKLQSYKSWIFKDIKGNKERKLCIYYLYFLEIVYPYQMKLKRHLLILEQKKNGIRTHAKYNTMTQKKKTCIYAKIANFKQRKTYLTRKSPKKTTTKAYTKANLNISSRNEWFWETRDMKNGTINEKWLIWGKYIERKSISN